MSTRLPGGSLLAGNTITRNPAITAALAREVVV